MTPPTYCAVTGETPGAGLAFATVMTPNPSPLTVQVAP